VDGHVRGGLEGGPAGLRKSNVRVGSSVVTAVSPELWGEHNKQKGCGGCATAYKDKG
jgi:hypothetical protein